MVSAMDANGDGKISRQELTILLHNIGILSSSSHPQTMLTEQELQDIVDELGEETSNPAEKLDKSSGSHGN